MKKDLIVEVERLLPEPVVVNIREELSISEDIDTEVDQAASKFGYYAVLSEKAQTKLDKLKFAFDVWKAKEEERIATEREYEGKKSLTLPQMTAYVKSQEKYKSYQLKLIEYEEQKRILKVIANAFEMKKDLVQTKAANRRNESSRR
jgi:hypothetical protein